MTAPRIAFFPDSFHEVNGVALTSRQFEAFARRRNLPFLCVRAGDRAQAFTEEGSVWTLELPRGFLSFALEKDLRFDPAFLRHIPLIGEVLERFRPELIHITGPSEVGLLGAGLAHHLELPLAASWHTNVHEYLVRRSDFLLRLLPERQSAATARRLEDLALATAAFFYSGARVLFAPNPELCARLTALTGRPCHLMSRGVDAELFNPSKRPSKTPSGEAGGVASPNGSASAALYQGMASAVPQPAKHPETPHGSESTSTVLYQGATSIMPQKLRGEALYQGTALAVPQTPAKMNGALAPRLPEGAIENSPGQLLAERGGSPGNEAGGIVSSPVRAAESSQSNADRALYQGTASAVPQTPAKINGALAPRLPEGAIENSPGQLLAERGGSPGNEAGGIVSSPVGANEFFESITDGALYQGTALAVPQQANKMNGALAPAILGFVGRLSVEKNIALLVELEQELERMGVTSFKFLIVGHGSHENWLRAHLHHAEFTGVLRGEALARAYASMDLFVFPSHTDTFGNAVLEAQASGVPAIVTPDGGPKTIVRDGVTGRVVNDDEFARAIAAILANPAEHSAMRLAARAHAENASWDAVFESVYAAYEAILPQCDTEISEIRTLPSNSTD
jgi:glycosyltransferase involved in cell wall biosynthesis